MTFLQAKLIGFVADLMLPEHKREKLMMLAGALMIAGSTPVVLENAKAPDNTTEVGLLDFDPNPGYRWKKPHSVFNHEVVWAMGQAHPDFPHVVASPKEGQFQPEDGYEFLTDQPIDEFAVEWKRGSESYLCPHVIAADKEGEFKGADGYVLKNKATCTVSWQEGLRLEHRPHMSASSREGEWKPDPGYVLELGPNGKLVAVEPRPVVKPRLPEFCGKLTDKQPLKKAFCEGLRDAGDLAETMRAPAPQP